MIIRPLRPIAPGIEATEEIQQRFLLTFEVREEITDRLLGVLDEHLFHLEGERWGAMRLRDKTTQSFGTLSEALGFLQG